MDIEIRKDVLLRALERCLYPSGKEEGREYAGRVLITVRPDDKTATCYALDTYLCVEIAVPLEGIAEAGEPAAINTRRLHTMVHNLRGEVVHMVVRDNRLTVTGDHQRRYTATLADASTFPPVQEPSQEAATITIAGPKLAYILKRAEHGRDPDKPNLDGVMLRAYKQEGLSIPTLECVSVSGYKTVVVKHQEHVDGTLPFESFMPSRLLKPLLVMAEKEESITLCRDGNFVYALTEDSLLGALLPREPFLDHNLMIKNVEPLEPVCEIPAIALRDAIKAIDAVRTAKNSCVRFAYDGGSLHLSLHRDETRASDSVPVSSHATDKFEFFAEPKYVLDHLKAADCDCTLLGSKAPVAFRTTDGYLGFVSTIYPESVYDDPPPKAAEKKDKGPGPGRGGKKKAAKKTTKKAAKKSKVPPPEEKDAAEKAALADALADPDDPPPGYDEEGPPMSGYVPPADEPPLSDNEEDELGSADPAQYTTDTED